MSLNFKLCFYPARTAIRFAFYILLTAGSAALSAEEVANSHEGDEKNTPGVVERKQTESPPADESSEFDIKYLSGKNKKPLTVEEVVRLVVRNNKELQLQRLEMEKPQLIIDRELSKYAPVIGLGYQGVKKIDEARASSIFQGTKMNSDTISASISKLFSTGTYLQMEVSRNRFDNNAGEGVEYQGTMAEQFAEPPLYTGELKLLLRQELLKNSFGYSQRRTEKMAANSAFAIKQQLIYGYAQNIVRALVDYWMLSVAEENILTAQTLLNNSEEIKNITSQKKRIGLAEGFEVNQWRALVAESHSNLERARLERDDLRRKLLRALNLPSDLELDGKTELVTELPDVYDVDADIEVALKTRPDLKRLEKERDNARIQLELSQNNLLPSVTIGGSFTHRDLSEKSGSSFREVPSGKYPEYGVEFRVEYRLWDRGVRADLNEAQLALKQISIKEKQLRREIGDEIRAGIENINSSHAVLKHAMLAESETTAFYSGLKKRYRQGRFNSTVIKNALDAVAQSKFALMRARINYNISLIRYELTRNTLFKKYNIDIEQEMSSQEG